MNSNTLGKVEGNSMSGTRGESDLLTWFMWQEPTPGSTKKLELYTPVFMNP